MVKVCRRCTAEFTPDDPRRTVCDTCRPPDDREKDKIQARKLRALKPLVEAADWTPELIEVGTVLPTITAPSQGTLVGTLRRLTHTQGREGTRSGLIRVAAISLALARRLR